MAGDPTAGERRRLRHPIRALAAARGVSVRYQVTAIAVVVVGFGSIVAYGFYERRYGTSPFSTGPPSALHWCDTEYSDDWAGPVHEGTARELSVSSLERTFSVGSPFGDEYDVFVDHSPTARARGIGSRVCPESVYLELRPDHYLQYTIPV